MLTVIPQWTKYSRYWMLYRVITRMRNTNWSKILIGNHSSWRDRTYWQSRQWKCFDIRTKCPLCWLRDYTQTKREKKQKKVPRLHRNATFLHILKNIIFLRAELLTNLTKVPQLLIFINKLLILFWLIYLFSKATSIRSKTGGNLLPIPWKWKLSLVSITSWL